MAKLLKKAALPPRQRILEVFLISAQYLRNLKQNDGKIKTYAAAYVDPSDKQCTRIDEEGGRNATWDERLTFSVEERVFDDATAQLTIDIYCQGTWKDKRVGTARVFISEAVKVKSIPKDLAVISIPIFHDSQQQGILNICIPPNGRFPERFDHSHSIQHR